VLVPFSQAVTFNAKDDPAKFGHLITVKSVAFDTPDVAAFVIDPTLPTVGDQKLAQLVR